MKLHEELDFAFEYTADSIRGAFVLLTIPLWGPVWFVVRILRRRL